MKLLLAAFFVLGSFCATAQTLFHYGNDSVSADEFLKAYKKNNTGERTEKAMRDYLDLYVASRLKIREAKDLHYDTMPQLVADLENLRQQILPSYLNDKEGVNKLVNEAFDRAGKDIHLAHIFISTRQASPDQLSEARRKLDLVNAELKDPSASFSDIAKKYSDDPAAKTNGGDLGWITVFGLPYELENLAYTTPAGKTSVAYQSKAGYHIFKNLGERKDPGKIKAAQILLAFPPDADDAYKSRLKKLADSLYMRIQKGDDFGKLASLFSNDVISAAANGQMQEFGAGQYESSFENAVFALPADGAVSKPFLTPYGYHIVKRLGKTPVVLDRNDSKARDKMQTLVEASDRMATTRSSFAKKILKTTHYQPEDFNAQDLYAYSDSILNYRQIGRPIAISGSTTLFKLGDKTYAASDWIGYAQTFRYKPDGSGMKPYSQLWNEFLDASVIDYYQTHLEEYNADFRQQLTEFREGNLFFEIMQRKIWGPAQTDSAALMDYYTRNKSKYNWKRSADAVIFYANDVKSANTMLAQLKKSPARWRTLVEQLNEKIAGDSSRFELAQIPNGTKLQLKAGMITPVVVNNSDKTASFAYIVRLYEPGGARSFAEARGLVINDYQSELEKAWIEALEQKYPVTVDQRVLASLLPKK